MKSYISILQISVLLSGCGKKLIKFLGILFCMFQANGLECYITNHSALKSKIFDAPPLRKDCEIFLDESQTDHNLNFYKSTEMSSLCCFTAEIETGKIGII